VFPRSLQFLRLQVLILLVDEVVDEKGFVGPCLLNCDLGKLE
jgi:hypothetical protein